MWSISEGSADQYEALKGLEIEEFYRVMDIWTAQKNKERERLESKR